jgi:hypothetical protein
MQMISTPIKGLEELLKLGYELHYSKFIGQVGLSMIKGDSVFMYDTVKEEWLDLSDDLQSLDSIKH